MGNGYGNFFDNDTVRQWAPPALVFVLALAVRLFRLASQSIWWDEAFSIHLAQIDVASAVRTAVQIDNHPPSHYLLLHYRGRLFGWGEVSVRLPSVLTGVGTVVFAYATVKQMFDRTTAAAVGVLTALAPPLVVYSQEARMYSLMAMLYAALLYAFARVIAERGRPAWGAWALLAVAEAAGMYTHYFFAFGVLSVNLIFAALWLTRRTSVRPWRWLASQGAALVLYLPWLRIGLEWALGFRSGSQATPTTVGQAAAAVWHFCMSGIYGMGGTDTLFTILSWLGAGALGLALIFTLLRDDARPPTIIMAAHAFLPLAFVFLVWQFSPVMHPRYVLPFSVPLYILAARAVVVLFRARWPLRALAALLSVALLAVFGVVLASAQLNPRYMKDDVRSMAKHLAATTSPGDFILTDWTDYSVSYYYNGSAPVRMSDAHDLEGALSFPQEAAASKGRCILVHRYGAHDARGLFSFALELAGRLVEVREFPGYVLRTYDLDRVPPALSLQPMTADFGPVQLTGAYYEDSATSDGAVCVALRWRLAQETGREYAIAVGLRDSDGWHWAQRDVPLLNEALEPTYLWEAGDETVNYYVLPVPAGLVPGTYSLWAGVYDRATLAGLDLVDESGAPIGRAFSLGRVRVEPAKIPGAARLMLEVNGKTAALADLTISKVARQFAPLPMGHEVSVRFGGFAELLGYDLDRTEVSTSEGLRLTLYWRASTEGPSVSYAVFTHVLSESGVLVGQHDGLPMLGQRPTTGWVVGEIIVDAHDIEFRDATYRGHGIIEVGLYDPNSMARVLTDAGEDHFVLPTRIVVGP